MKKISNPYNMKEFKKIESVDEKVKLFPFLKNIVSKEDIQEVSQLVEKISTATYEPSIKYNILWDVIQLGVLIESKLPDNITSGVTIKILDPIEPTVKHCLELTDQQQWCLFKLARNIVADSFHIMYEDQTRVLTEQVIFLCQGRNVNKTMSDLNREVNKISRGENITKILGADKRAQTKMFQQAIYFLERAKSFVHQENIPATCMALIGAGNCCRFIIRGVKESPTVRLLTETRSSIVHKGILDRSGRELIDIAQAMSGKSGEIIVKLASEAQSVGLELDVRGYASKEKSTETDESPRGYEKNFRVTAT